MNKIERLERIEGEIISTLKESLKRNMEFEGEIVNKLENMRHNHENMLEEFRKLNNRVKESNALTRELMESITLLEKNRIVMNKRLAKVEKKT